MDKSSSGMNTCDSSCPLQFYRWECHIQYVYVLILKLIKRFLNDDNHNMYTLLTGITKILCHLGHFFYDYSDFKQKANERI